MARSMPVISSGESLPRILREEMRPDQGANLFVPGDGELLVHRGPLDTYLICSVVPLLQRVKPPPVDARPPFP